MFPSVLCSELHKLLQWALLGKGGGSMIGACAANQVGSRVSAVGGVGLLAYSPPLPIANTRTRGQLGMGGKWTRGKQQIIQRPTFPTTNGHGVQILSPYLVREENPVPLGKQFSMLCH